MKPLLNLDEFPDNQEKLIKQLKENEFNLAIMQLFVDRTDGMIWMKKTNGKYIFSNNQLTQKLYGTTPENAVGKTDEELAQAYRNEIKDVITWGASCTATDKFTVKKGHSCTFLEIGQIQDEHFCLYVVKTPVCNKDGEIISVIGVALPGLLLSDAKSIIKSRQNNEETIQEIIAGYYYLGKT